MRAKFPTHFILLHLIIVILFGGDTNFEAPHCVTCFALLLLRVKYKHFPQHPALSLWSFLSVRDQRI
jgi:hypothetical protein